MTIADALSEPDLRALRTVLRGPADDLTLDAAIEQLRQLAAASQTALFVRDEASRALVRTAGSPPMELPCERIKRIIEGPVPRTAIVISLPATAGRDAWLVFVRDAGFTDADRITLALLRPHIIAALQRINERQTRRQRGEKRPLTARQHEVLRLVAQGYRNEEIARRLVVSVGTVRKHLDNVYRQLGVSGRAAAVASVLTADVGLARSPQALG